MDSNNFETPKDPSNVTGPSTIPSAPQAPQAPQFATAKVPEGKVLVDKATLDSILERLEKTEDMEKKIQMLTEVADSRNMAKWMDRNRVALSKECTLTTYKGKVVLAWKMVTNEVYKNQFGAWQENQTIEFILEDDTRVIVPYNVLGDSMQTPKIKATVLSSTTDEKNNVTWKVKAENGNTYNVGVQFVN